MGGGVCPTAGGAAGLAAPEVAAGGGGGAAFPGALVGDGVAAGAKVAPVVPLYTGANTCAWASDAAARRHSAKAHAHWRAISKLNTLLHPRVNPYLRGPSQQSGCRDYFLRRLDVASWLASVKQAMSSCRRLLLGRWQSAWVRPGFSQTEVAILAVPSSVKSTHLFTHGHNASGPAQQHVNSIFVYNRTGISPPEQNQLQHGSRSKPASQTIDTQHGTYAGAPGHSNQLPTL